MKILTQRIRLLRKPAQGSIKKIIRSNRGETIMESVASFLILSIVLAAITMMIQTSLKITATSTQNAGVMQEGTVNPVILSAYKKSEPVRVTFSNNAGISATHDVTLNTDEGIIAFYPGGE